jgi:hypothetical protein
MVGAGRDAATTGASIGQLAFISLDTHDYWCICGPKLNFSVYIGALPFYDAVVFDNSATAKCAAQPPTLTSDEHRR